MEDHLTARRAVVLGGGFAGLPAERALCRAPAFTTGFRGRLGALVGRAAVCAFGSRGQTALPVTRHDPVRRA